MSINSIRPTQPHPMWNFVFQAPDKWTQDPVEPAVKDKASRRTMTGARQPTPFRCIWKVTLPSQAVSSTASFAVGSYRSSAHSRTHRSGDPMVVGPTSEVSVAGPVESKSTESLSVTNTAGIHRRSYGGPGRG